LIDVTAAQLSEVTFVAGTDPTSLQVRAYDGVNWSAAANAQWAPFTVNVATTPPPVVTTSSVALAANQTVAASSLFTVSDPNSFAITEYQFWDSTSDPNSGHFFLNGVQAADHTLIDVTAAQLSEVTFVAGTDPTSLQVRAFDGVNWSAAANAQWAPFTVTPTTTVPSSNLSAAQTVSLSSGATGPDNFHFSSGAIAQTPASGGGQNVAAMTGHDGFTFATGPIATMDSAPSMDAMPSSGALANIHAVLTTTHDDFGNAAIPDAAHLWAHHSGFHFV